ncbi:hypothetical protein PsYK624_161870 [Phanerochaete sordida]|uniref:SWIM-type domain-containing protein n=1 Tax=Phanerochaete sordida TaxID=48140 RepID=A0A9P3LN44_9APHY|nr:hypothetical protein PsYK624_161870 [Phanerochaete sordida]
MKGELSAKCTDCSAREKETRQQKKRPRSAHGDASSATPAEAIPLSQFLDEMMAVIDLPNLRLKRCVDTSSMLPSLVPEDFDRLDLEQRVKHLASLLGDRASIHWTPEGERELKRKADDGGAGFKFTCAQSCTRVHKPKMPRLEGEARDRDRKPRFNCKGFLYINATKTSPLMTITMRHDERHRKYVNIELPDQWKDYIEEHALSRTAGDIWRHIEREELKKRSVTDDPIPFKSSAVYYYWHTVTEQAWKFAKDPFESARAFLTEKGVENSVEVLEIEDVPGTKALAFQITDFMSEWAEHTQELGMDSTWNTNSANFELFAAVAGAEGSGIPLAFLMIQSSKEAAEGAKEQLITSFLSQLKARGVNPEYTLSDKDWSEINAMNAVWPKAKHLLCFWHVLRALKKRLAKNKERPSKYDAEAAHREFYFISPTFVPIAQQSEPVRTCCPPATSYAHAAPCLQLDPPPVDPVRRVRLLIKGRPSVITRALPKIRLKGPKPPSPEDDATPPPEDFDLEREAAGLGAEVQGSDDEGSEDEGNHWTGRQRMAADDLDAYGIPDALDDDSYDCAYEDDEFDADDLRRQVDGVACDPETDSDEPGEDLDGSQPDSPPTTPPSSTPRAKAREYIFCPPVHRLPILRLIAKHASQHPLLPERHGEARTSWLIHTDAVQEMYQHCEANRLADVWAYLWNNWYQPSRWRLWARSTHATIPPYRSTLSRLLAASRLGYSGQLTSMQKAFKRSWKRLLKVPQTGKYVTSVETWTCDCGSQKYHAYLLCKHLVQAAGPMPASWWLQATRYHVPPFYTVPIDGAVADAPESKRSRAWLARMDADARSSSVESDDDRMDVEASTILSSPSKPPPTGPDGLLRTTAGDGAGFELDDHNLVRVQRFTAALRQAADIIDDQWQKDPHSRFVENAMRSLHHVPRFVSDVNLHLQRRTLPVTNSRIGTTMIGYLHDD